MRALPRRKRRSTGIAGLEQSEGYVSGSAKAIRSTVSAPAAPRRKRSWPWVVIPFVAIAGLEWERWAGRGGWFLLILPTTLIVLIVGPYATVRRRNADSPQRDELPPLPPRIRSDD